MGGGDSWTQSSLFSWVGFQLCCLLRARRKRWALSSLPGGLAQGGEVEGLDSDASLRAKTQRGKGPPTGSGRRG